MMMRTLVLLVAVLMIVSSLPAIADDKAPADKSAADAVLGKWWFPKKNGQLEITKSSGIYSGKVIAYDEPEILDNKNPDPELAKRKFVGIEMLSNFQYDAGEEQWLGGTIYDGDSGKTYKCTLWFEDGKPEELKARGYIGIALLGRTETFKRVTAADEQAAAEKK